MAIRVKDFSGSIQQLKDCGGLFGDKAGDDCLAAAMIERDGIDPAKRQFRFIASTSAVDLDDEVIAEGAFHELRQVYLGNPVMLVDHQHRLPSGMTSQAATCLQLQTEKNPVWGIAEMEDTAVGRDRAPLVLAGRARGISVGFRSRETDRSSGRVVHTKSLLLEISLVAVGANPQALVLSYVRGRLEQHGIGITDTKHVEEIAHMIRELEARLAVCEAAFALDAGSADEDGDDGEDPTADGEYEQREIAEALGELVEQTRG